MTASTPTLDGPIVRAIDDALEAAREHGFRPHLGASQIGRECDRAIWYGFRWATPDNTDARHIRIFSRGNDEEKRFSELLTLAGIEVVAEDADTGKQYNYSEMGGHFGGSFDGKLFRVPEHIGKWILGEYKTANQSEFNAILKHGLFEKKPEYYNQVQMYLHWSKIVAAILLMVCKNTERIMEIEITPDPNAVANMQKRAERIIASDAPFMRIVNDPEHYLCANLCEHKDVCYSAALPPPTCRSCLSATPVVDDDARGDDGNGQWHCEVHGPIPSVDAQLAGCSDHRYIPPLLDNFATAYDADGRDVYYKAKESGVEFINGDHAGRLIGYTSLELHKQPLLPTHPVMHDLKDEFPGATITGGSRENPDYTKQLPAEE